MSFSSFRLNSGKDSLMRSPKFWTGISQLMNSVHETSLSNCNLVRILFSLLTCNYFLNNPERITQAEKPGINVQVCAENASNPPLRRPPGTSVAIS